MVSQHEDHILTPSAACVLYVDKAFCKRDDVNKYKTRGIQNMHRNIHIIGLFSVGILVYTIDHNCK